MRAARRFSFVKQKTRGHENNARTGGRSNSQTRDYFGGGNPVNTPVGNDRILVQFFFFYSAKIQEARQQLSRVAKLEFRLVYPDNGERLKEIDGGQQVIPPEYRVETYTPHAEEEGRKPPPERLLVKKKADLARPCEGSDAIT